MIKINLCSISIFSFTCVHAARPHILLLLLLLFFDKDIMSLILIAKSVILEQLLCSREATCFVICCNYNKQIMMTTWWSWWHKKRRIEMTYVIFIWYSKLALQWHSFYYDYDGYISNIISRDEHGLRLIEVEWIKRKLFFCSSTENLSKWIRSRFFYVYMKKALEDLPLCSPAQDSSSLRFIIDF